MKEILTLTTSVRPLFPSSSQQNRVDYPGQCCEGGKEAPSSPPPSPPFLYEGRPDDIVDRKQP